MQGAAAPRPQIGRHLIGVEASPADQQEGAHGPRARPVISDGDMRSVHPGGTMPVILADAGIAATTAVSSIWTDEFFGISWAERPSSPWIPR